ncbi:MAG: sugar-transfer associated ATP-grasp domain-containing protein [Bacteroidota bacterium]|nr:sugar-transfer associated ATP-grasp domain-containing protein [Bacteroidota bacterium]
MLTSVYINDYKQNKSKFFTIIKTHLKGWSYNDWQVCGITKKNRKSYLSTREYCCLHPFNGNYSFWIDDKLTLKYILSGTKAGGYLPDYYYQIEDKILALPDLDKVVYELNAEGIAKLLEDKKTLAFKLVKGSLGVGFYKAQWNEEENLFYLNEQAFSRERFVKRIKELKGYIITEYLFPHKEFAKYCDKSVGCLRYTMGKMKRGEWREIISFMRIGTKKSKFVENYNRGGVLTFINNGNYQGGNIIGEDSKNIQIDKHPDNDIELKGSIPMWNEIVEVAHSVADTLPQLSYIGIDFCITNEDKIKIIEINSLTSLDVIETLHSIYSTSAGEFFKERLEKK